MDGELALFLGFDQRLWVGVGVEKGILVPVDDCEVFGVLAGIWTKKQRFFQI